MKHWIGDENADVRCLWNYLISIMIECHLVIYISVKKKRRLKHFGAVPNTICFGE